MIGYVTHRLDKRIKPIIHYNEILDAVGIPIKKNVVDGGGGLGEGKIIIT